MNTDLLIKGLLWGWFLATFQPIQDLLKVYVKPWLSNEYISTALSCQKCLSFWMILAIGALNNQFLFYEAITGAILAFVFEKILYSLKTYL